MRVITRAVSGALAAALAVGLVALPTVAANASTHTAAKSSHGVTVGVKVQDVVNKKGKYTISKWATIAIKVPGKFQDHYSDGTKYGSGTSVTYSVRVWTNGDATCGGKSGTTAKWIDGTSSKTVTLSLPFNNTVRSHVKHYTLSGKCTLHADVEAYRYTVDPKGTIDDITVKGATTFSIWTSSHMTTPSATSTHVKKNHSTTLSGKATAIRADSKHYYTSVSLPKGTKLSLQAKNTGGSWHTLRTVKVGSGGTWHSSVKITKATSYRVKFAGTRSIAPSMSGSRGVHLR